MNRSMEFSAEMIAGFLGGEVVGNPQTTVSTVPKSKKVDRVPSPSWPILNMNTISTDPIVDCNGGQNVRADGSGIGNAD